MSGRLQAGVGNVFLSATLIVLLGFIGHLKKRVARSRMACQASGPGGPSVSGSLIIEDHVRIHERPAVGDADTRMEGTHKMKYKKTYDENMKHSSVSFLLLVFFFLGTSSGMI